MQGSDEWPPAHKTPWAHIRRTKPSASVIGNISDWFANPQVTGGILGIPPSRE